MKYQLLGKLLQPNRTIVRLTRTNLDHNMVQVLRAALEESPYVNGNTRRSLFSYHYQPIMRGDPYFKDEDHIDEFNL